MENAMLPPSEITRMCNLKKEVILDFNQSMISIGIMLISSLIYGFAALKTYDAFKEAIHKKSRLKLWWAFSNLIFGFLLVLYAFFKTAMKM
jgi:hypothetical protein